MKFSEVPVFPTISIPLIFTQLAVPVLKTSCIPSIIGSKCFLSMVVCFGVVYDESEMAWLLIFLTI